MFFGFGGIFFFFGLIKNKCGGYVCVKFLGNISGKSYILDLEKIK